MSDKQAKIRGGESTRWKQSQSGNPAGRPRKEDCLTSLLKEQLAELNPHDSQRRTWARCVVAALLQSAAGGNVRAAGLVLERVEGKVKETVNVEPRSLVIRWLNEQDETSSIQRT